MTTHAAHDMLAVVESFLLFHFTFMGIIENATDDMDMSDAESSDRSRGMRKKFIPLVFLILFVIAGTAAAYFYNRYRDLKENPQRLAEEEVQKVVAEVAKLIVLPEGEAPTVAKVTDVERLKSQPFFANAKNGDRVLIYTNARKAILYRPEEHKLIEVAPLNLGTP